MNDFTFLNCDHCEKSFRYVLRHCGFGDSAYAYCDSCGMLALLDLWRIPEPLKKVCPIGHGEIDQQVEQFLTHCVCGGQFRKGASPRCPHCRELLSALAMTAPIERNAPGTAKGWRWQKSWDGLYCIAVEDHDHALRFVKDPWLPVQS